MILIGEVICIFCELIGALVWHYDVKFPASYILKYKYRVKDNSILRKIIKFKDKKNNPCNYFKIIPIYIFLIIFILGICLIILDFALGGIINRVLRKKIFVIFFIAFLLIYELYTIIVYYIWWGIIGERSLNK